MREAIGMREQLNRLLRLSEQQSEEPEEVRKLNIDDIEVNPYQPRKFFDDSALEELAESIRTYGVIQPLVVKKAGDKYRLIAGERRWRASRLAGLTHVPALVKDYRVADEPLLALVENVQRKDLNFLEEAVSYQKILQDYDITQQELAVKVGKSQAYIANKVRLLNLPYDALVRLVENNLSERHARALLKVETDAEVLRILEVVIERQLNVRDTERLVSGESLDASAPVAMDEIFTNPAYLEDPADGDSFLPNAADPAALSLKDIPAAKRRGRGPGIPSLDKYLNRIASIVNAMNEHGFNVIDSIEKKDGGLVVKIMIDSAMQDSVYAADPQPAVAADMEAAFAGSPLPPEPELNVSSPPAEDASEEDDILFPLEDMASLEDMADPEDIRSLRDSLARMRLVETVTEEAPAIPAPPLETIVETVASRHPDGLFVLDDEEELFKDIATLKEE